jgi:phage baseplate assembly protein V
VSASRIANQMRLQAALAAGLVGRPRQGLVTSYDPDAYLVKVRLQPEDVETGWLPIETALAGAGWGIYAGPAVGDLATVLPLESDPEVGWVAGFLPNDQDPPPNVPSGEILLKHKAGAFVRFTNDGKVHIEAAAGIESVGPWTHQGTLHVTDEVTADKSVTATVDVIGGGKHLKTHTHGGVQAGAGTSGPPT